MSNLTEHNSSSEPLLEVSSLSKFFPIETNFWGKGTKFLNAVEDVSFSLNKGETIGIVGESGCGKSSLAKAILRLSSLTKGDVRFKGKSLLDLNSKELRKTRKSMQMIFQDPYSSLNPRMTIFEILNEPFLVHDVGPKDKKEKIKIIETLIEKVGLPSSCLSSYPSSFSGGQRQRIAIARALALKPELVVADEPVSALDVSIQSQILGLFQSFRQDFGFSCVFISHDLAVVENVSDKVAVMYLGRIVEYGSRDEIFSNPQHPYTKALLQAVPRPEFQEHKNKKSFKLGELKEQDRLSPGCSFSSRCPIATTVCQKERPVLEKTGKKHLFHQVACHHV